MQTKHEIARYSGMSYAAITFNAMSWQSLVSFINPLQSNMPYEYLGTDQSMSNYFLGYISLISAMLFFLFSKHKNKGKLIFVILLFFILSLANNTPFYQLIYQSNPLVRLFRFPAYYMYYCYLGLVIASGYYLADVFNGTQENTKIFKGLILLVLLLLAFNLYKGISLNSLINIFTQNSFFTSLKIISPTQSYNIVLVFCSILLIGFGLLVTLKKYSKQLFIFVFFLDVIGMNTLSNLQVNSGRKLHEFNSFLAQRPANFEPAISIIHNSDSLLKINPPGMVYNYHAYYNIPNHEIFNSFYLTTLSYLDTNAQLLDKLNRMPFFQTQTPITLEQIIVEPNTIAFSYVSNTENKMLAKQLMASNWHLYINGIEYQFLPNKWMEFQMPSGNNNVEIKYKNNIVLYLFSFVYMLFGSCIIMFLYLHCTKKQFLLYTALIAALFLIAPIRFYLTKSSPKAILKSCQTNQY